VEKSDLNDQVEHLSDDLVRSHEELPNFHQIVAFRSDTSVVINQLVLHKRLSLHTYFLNESLNRNFVLLQKTISDGLN